LTKSIALKWVEIGETKTYGACSRRITPIRELAKYMNSIGVDSFVIPGYLLPRKNRYVPHLYTSKELSAIFSVLDRMPLNNRYPVRHFVFPVMFRMIYCCGLRPKEGREILRNNIDLKTGRIVIQESKNKKDRVIVLSTDMLKLCQQYDKKIDAVYPGRLYFFPGTNGNAYSYGWQQEVFHRCLTYTKMSFSGNQPRIYDLRHTFATNVLFRWMKEGKDMNAYLPYLSAYLGHEQFSDTAYYIHLVPQYFSQISGMYLNKHSHLIPEIENEN
jgi:integrase